MFKCVQRFYADTAASYSILTFSFILLNYTILSQLHKVICCILQLKIIIASLSLKKVIFASICHLNREIPVNSTGKYRGVEFLPNLDKWTHILNRLVSVSINQLLLVRVYNTSMKSGSKRASILGKNIPPIGNIFFPLRVVPARK